MPKIPGDLKEKIKALIPEDEDAELHRLLDRDDLAGVSRAIKGYYGMTDTICRGLMGATDEEKANTPNLQQLTAISKKWGPRYGQLEDIIDYLDTCK